MCSSRISFTVRAAMTLWGCSLGFVWSEELVAVEMHQMIRRIGNPDFRFPSNVRCKFAEGVAVKERGDENNVGGAMLGQSF